MTISSKSILEEIVVAKNKILRKWQKTVTMQVRATQSQIDISCPT